MKRKFRLASPTVRANMNAYLDTLPHDGSYEVVIQEHKTTRSLEQNGLYWLWIGVMCPDLGYTKDELHDALRDMLLEPVTYTDLKTGETKQRLRSTTKLGVKGFTAYLNAIEVWANRDMGMNLPHPEDQYDIAMGRRRG